MLPLSHRGPTQKCQNPEDVPKVHYQARSPKKEVPKKGIPPTFLRLRSLRKDQEKGRSSRKGDYMLCSHNIPQSIGILEILESNILKVEGCKSGMTLPRARSHDVQEWDSTPKGPGSSLCPDIMSLDTMERCILCGTVVKGEMD